MTSACPTIWQAAGSPTPTSPHLKGVPGDCCVCGQHADTTAQADKALGNNFADRGPCSSTLLSPFHHGAGNSGNTAILRTQEVAQPDGTIARIPFLSAASIRHGLRDALAWHLADTTGWAARKAVA